MNPSPSPSTFSKTPVMLRSNAVALWNDFATFLMCFTVYRATPRKSRCIGASTKSQPAPSDDVSTMEHARSTLAPRLPGPHT